MSWRFAKCSSGAIDGSRMPAASAIVFISIVGLRRLQRPRRVMNLEPAQVNASSTVYRQ